MLTFYSLIVTPVSSSLSLLVLVSESATLDATRATTTVWRALANGNVLLGFQTNHKGRHVDNLRTNTNVAVTNQNASMMHGLGMPQLDNKGLQPTIQEVLGGQSKHVIQLCVLLVQDTRTNQTAQQGIAFEDTTRILLPKSDTVRTTASARPPKQTNKQKGTTYSNVSSSRATFRMFESVY